LIYKAVIQLGDEFLSPKSDIIFKLLFGDERSIELLTDFLKSVLRLPADDYDEVTIIDPQLLREYKGDKLGILDVKVRTKSRKLIDIEIQLLSTPALRERIVFSLAKMITAQIGAGEDYSKIKRAVTIFIADFVFVPENDSYHNRYTLFDRDTGSEFTDLIEANILELTKLPPQDDGSELWNWLKFLSARKKEDLDMIAEKSPQVKKAVARLMDLSKDERTRLLYESRQMMEWDNRLREQSARAEGERANALFIARNMLADKMKIETIIKMTGLTREEVEGLAPLE